jgi:dystonin
MKYKFFFPPIKSILKPNKIQNLADEHLAELMPIFERLRAQGDLPCTYPLHVSSSAGTAFLRGGSRSTPLSPHAPHCHPSTHWVSQLIFDN